MKVASPAKCSWYPFIDEPLIEGLSYAPQFSNPQVIMPDNSCDGKWHMFFHSWIGIHHFVSDSGIAWEPKKVVVFRGHCPSIFKDDERFCLVYEKKEIEKRGRKTSGSRIEMRISTDLVTWSKPRVLLKGEIVSFASDYRTSPLLSNPQIIKVENGYRLYFGASNVKAKDSDYKCPRYFGYAFSEDLMGPYEIYTNSLLLESNGDDKYSNLAAGSIKLVKESDLYYAFQCSMYWDEEKQKCRSAIRILKSEDGIDFSECKMKNVLVTSDEGWTSSFIGTCDAHYKYDEDCWYCYYSARGGKKRRFEKESIGLMIGKSI